MVWHVGALCVSDHIYYWRTQSRALYKLYSLTHTYASAHSLSAHRNTSNSRAGWSTQPGFHGDRATESPFVYRHSGREGWRRVCLGWFLFVCVCLWRWSVQPRCLCTPGLCVEFNRNTFSVRMYIDWLSAANAAAAAATLFSAQTGERIIFRNLDR